MEETHIVFLRLKILSQLTYAPLSNLSPLVYRLPCGRTLESSFFHSATNRPPRMNRNSQLVFVFLILALSTAYTEVVTWHPCQYPDPDAPSNCTVHEVRVDPCREAAEGKPCKIKKGHSASISFDYTPNFSGDTLESRAYWASQLIDLPLLGMESNACTATACPVTPGQKTTYNMELAVSKKFPVRTYDVKWKLWNQQEQECCFIFQIKLHK